MTKWTDHVKREAQRLGLSYGCAMTDQRVKNSYRQLQSPPKAKRPKGRPKKNIRKSKSSSSSLSRSPLRAASPAKRKNSLQQKLREIQQMSPIRTPDIIRQRQAGVKGRKTGVTVQRNVNRDADSFENVDEFFDQFDST